MNPDSTDQAANAAPIDDRLDSTNGPRFVHYPEGVLRARSCARLSRPERVILQHVSERLWGDDVFDPDGDPACRIDIDGLAEILPISRRSFAIALAALVRDGMVLECPDGHRLGLDPGNWGGRRIRPHLLDYAVNGLRKPDSTSEEGADGDA